MIFLVCRNLQKVSLIYTLSLHFPVRELQVLPIFGDCVVLNAEGGENASAAMS